MQKSLKADQLTIEHEKETSNTDSHNTIKLKQPAITWYMYIIAKIDPHQELHYKTSYQHRHVKWEERQTNTKALDIVDSDKIWFPQ